MFVSRVAVATTAQPPESLLSPRANGSGTAFGVERTSAAATKDEAVSDRPAHAMLDTGDPAAFSLSHPQTADKTPSASRSNGSDTPVSADAGLLSADAVPPTNQNILSADPSVQTDPNPLQRLRFQAQDRDLAFDQFYTGQGGLLYLLNVLNRIV